MLKQIEEQLKKLLQDAGIENSHFDVPPKPEMGDVAMPCFDIAKREGKNPAEVAVKIAKRVGTGLDLSFHGIDKVEAFGPYVNFFLNTSELAKIILVHELKAEDVGGGKKVLIEYPSQNTHKEFHIGHLRNVCIGNTIVQLYRESGYDMIPMNYVNDFGRHVVKVLWGIENSENLKVESRKDNDNRQKWLGDVYAEASKYIEEHKEEVEEELNELQNKLESRDPEVMKLFEKTKQWSIEGFRDLMDELGVEHDSIMYESDVKDRGQEIVGELIEKGIAIEGERGAIIVDLEKYNLDIALLRKSTGAGVYMTSDLGLAERKFSHYDVAESINITGTEQNHYFKQLFKVLELNGFTHQMTHIGYGLVNLPSGKMSSRAGNVILYEDLRDEIFAHLKKETASRHEDWSEEKINKTVHVLTQAVLKFTMQKHESIKNMTFDMDEAVSFEGYSAPYVLYVVARINSLVKRAEGRGQRKVDYNILYKPEEKQILMKMSEYGDVVAKARENYNTSAITRYCFELAKAFNNFYNTHDILKAESDELIQARLALSVSLRDMLTHALGLLTIDVVDEM